MLRTPKQRGSREPELPELLLFPAEEQGRKCIREHYDRAHWWAGDVIGYISLFLAAGTALKIAWYTGIGWTVLLFLPIWAIFFIVPLAGLHVLSRRRLQRFLRQELVRRGIAVCLRCGYDLRGQTEPRCPECGTPFDSTLLAGPESRT